MSHLINFSKPLIGMAELEKKLFKKIKQGQFMFVLVGGEGSGRKHLAYTISEKLDKTLVKLTSLQEAKEAFSGITLLSRYNSFLIELTDFTQKETEVLLNIIDKIENKSIEERPLVWFVIDTVIFNNLPESIESSMLRNGYSTIKTYTDDAFMQIMKQNNIQTDTNTFEVAHRIYGNEMPGKIIEIFENDIQIAAMDEHAQRIIKALPTIHPSNIHKALQMFKNNSIFFVVLAHTIMYSVNVFPSIQEAHDVIIKLLNYYTETKGSPLSIDLYVQEIVHILTEPFRNET